MKKVLIIEDEEFILDMYKIKFEQSGYSVEIAHNGEEGLEKIKTLKPDIVLLDLMMPKMDGYQVLEKVRVDNDIKNTKIHILSNFGQDDEIKKSMAQGADGYLVKSSITPGEIVNYVKKVLSEKEMSVTRAKAGKKAKKKVNKDAEHKVLIIEDETDIAEMYEMKLLDAGFAVDIAKNGAWGLKMAKKTEYDIIVMDMMMPAMNGYEMLDGIKKNSKNHKTLVVVLSNSAQDGDIKKAMKLGATSYLLKSTITPAKLVKELGKLVKKK